jgi:biotin transport system ATP-binding protein
LTAEPPILTVQDLTHTFDSGQTGVDRLCFSVAKGEFLILAGSNGSGKTTLLRLLMGLMCSDSGEIRLKGRNILEDLMVTRTAIGLVFQDTDTQILGETVYSEIAFGPENLGQPQEAVEAAVTRVMAQMGLSQFRNRHPASLSGGEKRRLTIAGVLAMAPDIILFDEPFANLDYPAVCGLVRQMKDLHCAGTTMIIATHDLAPALALADRIMIMDKGRIRAQGPVEKMAPHLGTFGLFPWCPACQPLKGME